MREPGRVNINTITDRRVWQGIMNNLPDGTAVGTPASTESWQKLIGSRRGYGANDSDVMIGAPTAPGKSVLPTFFANPFRSYAGLYLVPIPEMQIVNFTTGPTLSTMAHPVLTGEFWRNEIDSTLLRVDQTTYGGLTAYAPLLATNPKAAADIPPFADPLANPYFHYQGIQKISNLVTTRSNVYSVWITVGYFEVERVPISESHPDGWRLRHEMGVETGEIERHRGYYLIDRSLPVGFQRGEDSNVQQTILLKRMIN
jgi:hypothetical protein